jgi:RNA polymerase sigma factor (sigma-70 family)
MIATDTVLKHLAMTNKLAHRYAAKNPAERDEIVSAAYCGLLRAAEKPNPANSYVARWVRGAINRALPATSLTHRDRQFLARYSACQGNMADRADALGLSHEHVFLRLANMTTIVPLYDDCPVECRPEGNLNELLEVCLAYLPRKLHWAFVFKYRDQLTQNEIALRTGMSPTTICQHLQRALKILRLNKDRLADILL